MSLVVFAAPPPPPTAPPPPPFHVIRHRWTGWDGSQWIFNRDMGVYLAPEGIRGMGMPEITRYTRESAALNGTIWRGMLVEEREVFWPLRVRSTTSTMDAIDLDRRLWKTLHPRKTGRWDVILPSGDYRSLDLRLADDGGHETSTSLFTAGIDWYGVTLVAEQPFWRGQPLTRSWSSPAPKLFRGGGDPDDPEVVEAGPPYHVNRSANYDSAVIANMGDVEVWPVWTIYGPCDSATVGVGDSTITIPFALETGETLTIDTDPTDQTAIMDDGTDRTDDLGDATFAQIDEGAQVELNVETVNGGEIQAKITPLYLRAY